MRASHCRPQRAGQTLKRHASELAGRHDDDQHPESASAAELDALRDLLQTALEDGTPTRIKPVLQAMIDGLRVDGRDHIAPAFRVPTGLR
jgi:hypothetical protein